MTVSLDKQRWEIYHPWPERKWDQAQIEAPTKRTARRLWTHTSPS
jgi:hypothetical protein